MDYIAHYNKLIFSRKNLSRRKGEGIYYERHHIIPKWLGGTDGRDNLILLTAREHFVAHHLLWKHYRDRPSALAFHRMTKSKNPAQQRIFTAAHFEKARIAFVETQKGEKNWSFVNGSPAKGKPSPNKGKKLGKRDWMTGDNNHSKLPEVRLKISESLKGRKKSQEHIKKLTAVYYSKPKLKCPHCPIEVDYRNFKRWHGDNCKKHKAHIPNVHTQTT
jgi:hypothetical protein